MIDQLEKDFEQELSNGERCHLIVLSCQTVPAEEIGQYLDAAGEVICLDWDDGR